MVQEEQKMIRELETEAEWRAAFPVMKQLRVHLDEEDYIHLVRRAHDKEGYHLAVLEVDQRIAAAVGFMPMVTLYNGSFVWVCDLVTDQKERSKGYGEELLQYVHQWAKDHGCKIVSLSSGLQRKDAHRFYKEKMEYQQVSYVFLKNLE